MKAIDLFAGWGGFTLGAERAGIPVVWAGNHWTLAVEAHARNHPDTIHVCQDLRQADWSKLPDYDLLLASPACQGHSQAAQPSRAKAKVRAYHDALRATAWAVVDCADATEPRALVVENVADFLRWRLYPVWRDALEALGYRIQELRVRASTLGVPQRRDRIFVVGTRSGRPVSLPSSGEPAFGPCVEWGEGRWREVGTIGERAQERIRRGRARHGDRFITQHVTGHPGVPLSEPIRTITTKDQWGVVDGPLYRPLTVRETARAMGFPDEYSWPADASRRDKIRGLGNAVPPPVAKVIVGEVASMI